MNERVPPPPEDGSDRIIDEPLTEALSRRYLAYALSTIMGRALPDVRDGLKPVHRRLLYAMRILRQAALGVAHGRGVIAVDIPEIPLPLDQRISLGEILG